MTVRVLAAAEDMVSAVADALRPEGNDYRRNLVVFPGNRPAHFLRRELARRVGGAFLPPLLQPIDDLAAKLASLHRGADRRLAGPLDAAAILFDLYAALPERPGGKHFLTPERFLPLGLQLFDELE